MTRIGVVLVGGIIKGRTFGWVPDGNGMQRITKIRELWKAGQIDKVIVIGAKPVGKIPNGAEIYRKSLVACCPEIKNDIAIVQAEANCTARDIVAVAPLLDEAFKEDNVSIVIVSYKEHAIRASITFRYCGYDNVEIKLSGEQRAYPLIMEGLLTRVTEWDPRWKWFPLCVFMANWNILRYSHSDRE